jgi:cobalamin biosynthesis Mg chelatase CobN
MQTEHVSRTETRAVETPVEARQGFLDQPVLVVLIVSLALVIVAFGVVWLPTVL